MISYSWSLHYNFAETQIKLVPVFGTSIRLCRRTIVGVGFIFLKFWLSCPRFEWLSETQKLLRSSSYQGTALINSTNHGRNSSPLRDTYRAWQVDFWKVIDWP